MCGARVMQMALLDFRKLLLSDPWPCNSILLEVVLAVALEDLQKRSYLYRRVFNVCMIVVLSIVQSRFQRLQAWYLTCTLVCLHTHTSAAVVNKLIKEMVPNIRVSTDARDLLLNCCSGQ